MRPEVGHLVERFPAAHNRTRPGANDDSYLTPEELAEHELQRRLVAAGVLSEIKPPPRFVPAREPFKPVSVQGEPLSETIIRERR